MSKTDVKQSSPLSYEDMTAEMAAGAILSIKGGNKYSLIDRALSLKALSMTDGNVTAAAKLLGVHRRTLQRKLKRHQDGRRKRSAR